MTYIFLFFVFKGPSLKIDENTAENTAKNKGNLGL